MRTRLHFVIGIAFQLSIVGAGPAAVASQQDASSAVLVEGALKAGEYIWQPERSPSGPIEIVISLSQQLAYVFRSGELIGLASVSTGTDTRPTPDGRYRILQKKRVHRSIKYDNAPMPHMMRLTWYGIALHGGHNPGYPASHGCIRLPLKFAEALFAVTPPSSYVLIAHEAPGSPEEALDLMRAYQASNPTGDAPIEPLPQPVQE